MLTIILLVVRPSVCPPEDPCRKPDTPRPGPPLHSHDTFFRNVVDTVREPLLVLDHELRVRTASASFYRTFQVLPAETDGRHLDELGNGQWKAAGLAGVLEEVVAEGRAVEGYEVTHHFERIGTRTMLLNARRIAVQAGEPALLLLAIEDVTERRRVEEERDRAMAELRRSNAELERFAYVASHDLQEPLRMVASYTQLLARRYQGRLDEKADRFIAYAVEGATRMQALINDLLTFSRLGSRGPAPADTDAGEVLRRALANLEVAVRGSGAVVTHDPLPTVAADPTLLLQLFQNVLSNAIKFRAEAPPRVHVSAAAQGGEWVFSVRDNGIGIDPAYAERVFVVFQRLHTRAEHPGTGIGLAICKKIVELHGGRMWLQSQPGEGSTFLFTLPAASGA